MGRFETKQTDRWSGRGRVFHEDRHVANVQYDIREYQQPIQYEEQGGCIIDVTEHPPFLTGTFRLLDDYANFGNGDGQLLLYMEDGRVLRCVVDGPSSGGRGYTFQLTVGATFAPPSEMQGLR